MNDQQTLATSSGSKLLAVALFAIALFLVQSWFFIQNPWLGATFAPSPDGGTVQILSIDQQHPNHQRVTTPFTVRGYIDVDGNTTPLMASDILEEPDIIPSLEEFNDFFRRQSAIHQQLISGKITFISDNHTRVELTTVKGGVGAIPMIFYAQQLFGIVGLLIGAGVWLYTRNSKGAKYLFVTGLGFYLSCVAASFYSSRELAIDGDLFFALSSLNHLGVIIFSASFLLLLWYYPKPISSKKIEYLLLPLFAVDYIATVSGLTGAPSDGRYIPIVLTFMAGIAVGVAQWRRLKRDPVERAALKWFLFSIYLGTAFFTLIAALPMVMGIKPLAEQSVLLGTFLLMYIGMALGVARYRLFELDRWWIKAWFWFFGGLTLVLTDVVILYLIDINQMLSLTLSILIVGWLYFPARQYLLQRLFPEISAETLYMDPDFTNEILAVGSEQELGAFWINLMQKIFAPLEINEIDGSAEKATLIDQGEKIQIPHITVGRVIEMRFRSQGQKLFNSVDLKVINHLHQLSQLALQSIHSRELERKRISRDLHDDLGAKILRMVHNAADETQRQVAMEAMNDLRDTLNNLEEKSQRLILLFGDIRTETETRLKENSIDYKWQDNLEIESPSVSARFATNIRRIMREIITNALKHSAPQRVEIAIDYHDSQLKIVVVQDGNPENPQHWESGRGTKHIQTRLSEINGSIDYYLQNEQLFIDIAITIS